MLRILDANFNILETIPCYTSVEFEKVFNDYGSFTVQIPLAVAPEYIAAERILQHKNNYGIIRYIEQNEGYIIVKGYDLKSLMMYRMVFGNKSGKAESVIKEYLSENTTGNRAFTAFNVTSDQSRGSDTAYSIESAERLDSVIKNICEASDIGYDVTVSGKQMYFDVKIPQTVNYIYSARHNNIRSYTYTKDGLNNCTFVYKRLKPNGLSLSYDNSTNYLTIGGGTGYFANGTSFTISEDDTKQIKFTSGTYYIYARLSTSGNAVTYSGYSSKQSDSSSYLYFYIGKLSNAGYDNFTITENDMEDKAITLGSDDALSGLERKETFAELSGTTEENDSAVSKILAENDIAENIEAELLTPEDYGTKWNLGDYVKLKVRVLDSEITLTKQISAVTEVYEANSHRVTPTFGKIKESTLKKIIRNRR